MRTRVFNVATTLAMAAVLAGCGGTKDQSAGAANPAATSAAPDASQAATSAPSAATAEEPVKAENNPPGDIPDNLAFVRYSNKSGRYSFTHPEGWAQTASGGTV